MYRCGNKTSCLCIVVENTSCLYIAVEKKHILFMVVYINKICFSHMYSCENIYRYISYSCIAMETKHLVYV